MSAVSWSDLPLAEHHVAELMKSGISPEVAAERGYRTEKMISRVKRYGFSEASCQMPGLLMPIHDFGSDPAGYQYKPDAPRIVDGKPNKYESPRHAPCQLDVPPRARPWVLDPAQPLVFTEGIKKGDSGATHELACLDVAGVWNWRSADVVASLDQIELKGRTVYLVFDSDYRRNKDVRYAKKRLGAVLRQRGAIVYDVLLPEPTPGIKVGLDDWLANGGSPIDLFRLEMVELTADDDEPAHEERGPYLSTPAGIVYRKPTPNGPVDTPLSNFTARIVEEVIADDGASERAEVAIDGSLGAEGLPRLRVPMRRFAGLDWVSEWGTRPRIAAGFGNRDRLREAIQVLSPDPARRSVFEHPGWREIPKHGWCYLHAGGAIGAAGVVDGIDVALRGAAGRITFPDPPSGDALRQAVRASLGLLDLAPDPIMASLLGATYRAPLCALAPADLSIFLEGPTGVFKSETAALAMQHYGADFDRLHVPANWAATANFLERICFDFKDAPVVIDDFAPAGSATDVARLHASADRVLRGIGNRGGRGRMNADGTLRSDYPPRGIVLGTGEDVPRGQSLRSRIVAIGIAPGDVDRRRLTAAQDAGRSGVFVAGLAGSLHWIAPRFETLRARLPGLLAHYRRDAYRDVAHARTPDAVAHLALGWWAFLRYAADVGAISDSEARAMGERVWTALGETAARQTAYQRGEEPARRFLDLLSSALAGGFAHVAAKDGSTPHPSEPWGWRRIQVGGGEYQRFDWKESGVRVGWIDGEDLYLDLESAIAATQRVSQSGIAVGAKTLAKRLHEGGFLASTEQAHGDLRVRRTLEGRRRSALHLRASTLTAEESRQSRQSDQNEAEPTQTRGFEATNGGISWRDFADTTEESRHKIPPEPTESCGDGGIGGIGGVFVA